jgi:hypothetical protein
MTKTAQTIDPAAAKRAIFDYCSKRGALPSWPTGAHAVGLHFHLALTHTEPQCILNLGRRSVA